MCSNTLRFRVQITEAEKLSPSLVFETMLETLVSWFRVCVSSTRLRFERVLHEKHVRYQKHQDSEARAKEMDYRISPRKGQDKAQSWAQGPIW